MRPGSAPFRMAGQSLPSAVPLAASALLLSACAVVVGPTVPVQPSASKSPFAFQGDHAACMASTTTRVQPVADRGTNGTAAIQGMSNAAYSACMAVRGTSCSPRPRRWRPRRRRPGAAWEQLACPIRIPLPPGKAWLR